MRKVFKFVTTILILLLSLSLTSCKDNNNLEVNYVVDIKKTESVGLKDIYTIYYKDGSTEKFEITNGENGQDGKPGIDGKPGENGQDGIPGINGVDGKPGIDGKTPHIGENGNWFIGDYDTGISATGPQGKPGQNGVDGKPGENGQDGKPGENAPHYGETFKVTFDLNGGRFAYGEESVVTVTWGDTLDLPIPFKTDYGFVGWYTGNTVNDKKFTCYDAVFRDVTLVAKYEKYENKVTCQKANEMTETSRLQEVIIEGIVKEVHDFERGTITIYDESGEFYLYTTFDVDGANQYATMKERPYKGDRIVVKTKLDLFLNKPEGTNSKVLEIERNVSKDNNIYNKISIRDAREISDCSFVELTGEVAFVNYGWNKRANGYYLIDGTESIYVTDGRYASTLKVGNRVTIKGEKFSYIYPTAIDKAEAIGYTGSTQIKNVTLVENDGLEHDIDLSFAEEYTITELMNKPYGENYRTKIYKVTGIIKKQNGQYLIYDLDNKTGSIIYDYSRTDVFSYLDKYEEQVLSMYVSVMSMKLYVGSAYTEFIPIQINGENQPYISQDKWL